MRSDHELLFFANYQVRPGLVVHDPPLSIAERQRLYYLRRQGKAAPYPFLAAELEANAVRNPDTGCLEWARARNGNGYGRLRRNGRLYYPHRLALELALGRPIAEGMVACHRCDNPACIEPTHLYEGSKADNTKEMWAKGRHNAQPADLPSEGEWLHPYDEGYPFDEVLPDDS